MEIMNACFKYSFLGLSSNERWLAELLDNSFDDISSDVENSSDNKVNFSADEMLKGLTLRQKLKLIRAKSYMNSREYSRVVGILSEDSEMNDIALALFMKNYSLLISLEKQNTDMEKFENMVVNPSDYAVISVNYSRIERDILNFLNKRQLIVEKSNNEFVGLLEWLLSVVVYKQNRFSEALDLQIRSVCNEPCNWSCWVDMVKNITRHNSNNITGSTNTNKNGSNANNNENNSNCVISDGNNNTSLGLNGMDLLYSNNTGIVMREYIMSQRDKVDITDQINENQSNSNNSNVGLQLFRRKNNFDAFKQLRDSCYNDYVHSLGLPNCMFAHLSYGLYLEKTGKWKDALNEYLSISNTYFPDNVCSYVESQIAKCNYELGDLQNSLIIHQNISNKDKYYLGNVIEIATILSESNNVKELSLLAKKCVEMSKYSLETCIVLGMYHWLTNDKHKALRFYKRALLFDNKSSFIWVLCGHALHELGNIRGSLFAYKTANNLDSTNITALFGIAQIYSNMNLHPYSIKVYEKALLQSPTDPFLWFNLGVSSEKLGDYQEASRYFYKALSFEISKGKISNGTDIKYMGKLLKMESEQWNQPGTLYWAKKIIQRAIEYGYLEKIENHGTNSDFGFGSCDQNVMGNSSVSHHENVLVPPSISSDKQKNSINFISYQEENNDMFFLEWDKLRWSVRMIPQKLPVDVISAIESIMQIQSSISLVDLNKDDKYISKHEVVLENLRELLNVPKPIQVARE
ncbi:TPR domain protein [Cryptosporidium bovis]|uniref:TPR domain protein n=1 Tax=Cryptosporidium bovis TaxID=310047 RepID=UPI003519F3C2|nr:TPR domain protein [Cryptosporidium bovis]